MTVASGSSGWRLLPPLGAALFAAVLIGAPEARAEMLEGHGGPIKAIAADPASGRALTASFDNALGLWALDEDAAPRRLAWLDGHEAGVSAAAFALGGAWAVSAADDFTVGLWPLADLDDAADVSLAPSVRLAGHRGKVTGVAVAEDGDETVIVSAGWDGRVGLWRGRLGAEATGFSPLWLEGHRGAVTSVAIADDGQTAFSGSADGTVRRWDLASARPVREEARHGFAVNALVLHEPGGWLAYGAADGVVRVIALETGEELAALTGDRRPILALSVSPDGGLLAYGDGHGFLTVVETRRWTTRLDVRAAARGPVWALAFTGADALIAGGIDTRATLWPLAGALGGAQESLSLLASDGAPAFQVDPATVPNGERQFARKCSICHALGPDGGRRAGPSLHGLYGREAGGRSDYVYSDALAASGVVWSAETVARLFELGPDVFTPGSKMPNQVISDPADRADLAAYLASATASGAPPASAEATTRKDAP